MVSKNKFIQRLTGSPQMFSPWSQWCPLPRELTYASVKCDHKSTTETIDTLDLFQVKLLLFVHKCHASQGIFPTFVHLLPANFIKSEIGSTPPPPRGSTPSPALRWVQDASRYTLFYFSITDSERNNETSSQSNLVEFWFPQHHVYTV